MRFTMSSDDKQSTEVPSFVISPSETSSTPEKKSQKRTVIIAVTCVAVAILVLICVLVSIYMFTEAEKEITKLSLELKNNMTQDVTSNPNTNVVQFHVQQKDQEAWIINDYNSDLKVMKIQTSAGTNCFVTPLNESSPTDLPSMKSLDTQKADTIALVYSTNGSPIKDTSFLSKTARDACKGISTYWLYPSCDGSNGSKPNTTDLVSRQKRGANYYTTCGGYYFVSNYNFYYTCSYYYCYAPYLTTCYTFSATWLYPYSRSYPYNAYMYKCLYYGFSGCVSI